MATNQFAIVGNARLLDDGLGAHLREFATFTGRELPDVARTHGIKPLLRYAINETPPGSAGVKGQAAKRAGEQAILTDLSRMGFVPVQIKGYRMLTHVYGHKLETPIRVETKPNPQFDDPEAYRKLRLAAAGKRGGRVSRGGEQAFYVDRRKFNRLKTAALANVGRLASWVVPAARELGLTVPAWITRHAGLARGTSVQIVTTGKIVVLRVVGQFPPGTEDIAAEMERRIPIWRGYVRNGLARQVKAMMSRGWSATRR